MRIIERYSPIALYKRWRIGRARLNRSEIVGSFGHGIRLWINPDMFIARMYAQNSYEPHVVSFLKRRVGPRMTCVDIGANVGFFTVLLARLVGTQGTVIAFEPTPSTADMLERNLHLNDLTNVSVERKAVAEREQVIPFNIGRPGFEVFNSAGDVSHPAAKSEAFERIEVQAVRFDDYIQREAPSVVPDVVKIDVEGGELGALRGMTKTLKRHGPTLLIEFSDLTSEGFGHSVSEMIDFLTALDYRLNVVGPFGKLRSPYPDERWRGQMVVAEPESRGARAESEAPR